MIINSWYHSITIMTTRDYIISNDKVWSFSYSCQMVSQFGLRIAKRFTYSINAQLTEINTFQF